MNIILCMCVIFWIYLYIFSLVSLRIFSGSATGKLILYPFGTNVLVVE